MPKYLNRVLRYGAQTGLIYLLLRYFPGNQMQHTSLLLISFVILVASIVVELSLTNTLEGFDNTSNLPICDSCPVPDNIILINLIYDPVNKTMKITNLTKNKLTNEHINLIKKETEQYISSRPTDRHVFKIRVDTSEEPPKIKIINSEATMNKPYLGEIQSVKQDVVQPTIQQVRKETPVYNVQEMRQEVSLPTSSKIVQDNEQSSSDMELNHGSFQSNRNGSFRPNKNGPLQPNRGLRRGPIQPSQTVNVNNNVEHDLQNGDRTVDQARSSQPRTIPNMDPYTNDPHRYPVPNQTSVRSEYLKNKDALYDNYISQLENQKNITDKMYVTKEQVGSRAQDGVLQNEMMFTDYNTLQVPQNYQYTDDDYGWNFLPPKDWYPIPPNPPICVSEKKCSVCPVYTDGSNLDLKMWDESRRITPPDRINTDYVKMKLNSGR